MRTSSTSIQFLSPMFHFSSPPVSQKQDNKHPLLHPSTSILRASIRTCVVKLFRSRGKSYRIEAHAPLSLWIRGEDALDEKFNLT